MTGGLKLQAELDACLRGLFPLCRSLTGEANRQTLCALNDIAPVTIHEVPTGKAVYDWVIPCEWNIRDAWIADSAGRRVVDFRSSNLHVVSYSEPVNLRLDWEQLKPRLHVHPDLPDAIPYRTTYYRRDWGVCLTRAQYAELERIRGPFDVVIDADLKPGSLTYGEVLLRGKSPKEILISCYICHPSMANDSLSGVIIAAFLARHLASRAGLNYSYRIAFVPETLGAIAYCAENEQAMKNIDIGLVITTAGGPGKFGYKQSWDIRHPLNRMVEDVFREAGEDFFTYPFDIHGSDERQYSSQGFRINCTTISKDRYYEYPEYHSSLDNLGFVTAENLEKSFSLYVRLIDKLESRRIFRSLVPNGEAMLSKRNLYPATGGAQRPLQGGRSELDLILWILFLSDGRQSTEDIALTLGVPVGEVDRISLNLAEKGTLAHV
jgi:aminopeptidase-like protein